MKNHPRLRSKRSALLAAVAVHLGLGALLALVHFGREKENRIPSLIVWSSPSPAEAPLEVPRQSLELVRQPPTPSPSQLKVVAAKRVLSPVQIREPDLLASEAGLIEGTLGLDDVFGEGGGMMELLPDPRRFKLPSRSGEVPQLIRENRCNPEKRRELLLANGGSDESERAVMKALRWLHQKQNEDGSWGETLRVKMTSLAVLAFLGHCETHESVEFGEAIVKAVQFLAERAFEGNGQLRSKGLTVHKRVANEPLEHAMGTYALCDAYAMVRDASTPFPLLTELEQAIRLAMSFSEEICVATGGKHWRCVEGRDWEIVQAGFSDHSSRTTLLWMAQAHHASRLLAFEHDWRTALSAYPSSTGDNLWRWRSGIDPGENDGHVNGERDFVTYDNHAYHKTLCQGALFRQCTGREQEVVEDQAIDDVLQRTPILGLELFDLRVVQAKTPEDLPKKGEREVWVGGNHDRLYLRIYDGRGVMVVDANQSDLAGEGIAELREEIGRYRSHPTIPLRKYLLLQALCWRFKLHVPHNYEVFVITSACFNRGGERWEKWNLQIRDQLIGYQK